MSAPQGGLAPADLTAVLQTWADRPDAWQLLARHDHAERVYALLHRDAGVEIYLVCWMPGHDTGFHDHDDSAAAITVVDGTITEERLAITGRVERAVNRGDTVTIAREAIHRVRHAGTQVEPSARCGELVLTSWAKPSPKACSTGP